MGSGVVHVDRSIVLDLSAGEPAAKATAPDPVPVAEPKATPAPVQRPPKQHKPAPKELTTISNALIHTVISSFKLVFLTPYNIWMKSASNLEKQMKEKSFSTVKISATNHLIKEN